MAEIPPTSFQGPLVPKMGLGDSFKSPLHENQNEPPPKSGKRMSRFLPYGAIAIALLVLPLTISQLSQQQDIRQRASEPVPTIILPTKPLSTPTPTPDEAASPSATPEMEIIEDPLL